MYRPALSRLVFRVVGLLVIPILAALATACGAPEESKPRPLPEDPQTLSPGTYVSEEYEPSLSFRVGKGWSTAPPESPDDLLLIRAHDERRGVGFANAQDIYKPTKNGVPIVEDAPEDMVGWFRRHPYLQTSKPEPVTVGGVEGEQFDVVVGDLPQDYLGVCGRDCVATLGFSDGTSLDIYPEDKLHLIVLEDVEGETVVIGFGSPTSQFDEFAPMAQKVIDTVEWRSS
jgi:hypothetical protein